MGFIWVFSCSAFKNHPHSTLCLFFFVLDIELRNAWWACGRPLHHTPSSRILNAKVFQCNDSIMLSIKYILILHGIFPCPCQFLYCVSLLIYIECCLFCYLSENHKVHFVLSTLSREYREGCSDSGELLHPFPVLLTSMFF